MVGECVDKIVNEVETPGLKDLLNKFKYSQDRYIYDHSYLTSVFAISMCEKFSWRNTKNFEKLVFAALVHDYGFSNDYDLNTFNFLLKQGLEHNDNTENINKTGISCNRCACFVI